MNGYACTLMIQEEAKREAKVAAHLDKIYLDERRKLGLDSEYNTNNNEVLKNIVNIISDMNDTMIGITELIRQNTERIEELERKYESLPIQLFYNSEEEANKCGNV